MTPFDDYHDWLENEGARGAVFPPRAPYSPIVPTSAEVHEQTQQELRRLVYGHQANAELAVRWLHRDYIHSDHLAMRAHFVLLEDSLTGLRVALMRLQTCGPPRE